MRRTIYTAFALALVVFLSGCSAILNMGDAGPITGTWTGLDQKGSKVMMTFNKDHSMKMKIASQNSYVETKGKFRIDYSGNPYALNLYDLDMPGYSEEAEFHAVVSFSADNRMTYIGKYAVNGIDEKPTVSDVPHMIHVEFERVE